MRANYLFIIISALIYVVTSSCSNQIKVKGPDELGFLVFEMLEEFDDISSDDFLKKIISYEDLIQMASNPDVIEYEETRKEILNLTEAEWKEDVIDDYNSIKSKAVFHEIKWTNIKYSNFDYEIKYWEGVKKIEGKLIFKKKVNYFLEITYSVKVESVYDGKYYKILYIHSLMKE